MSYNNAIMQHVIRCKIKGNTYARKCHRNDKLIYGRTITAQSFWIKPNPRVTIHFFSDS